jgi:hypothetical protein
VYRGISRVLVSSTAERATPSLSYILLGRSEGKDFQSGRVRWGGETKLQAIPTSHLHSHSLATCVLSNDMLLSQNANIYIALCSE